MIKELRVQEQATEESSRSRLSLDALGLLTHIRLHLSDGVYSWPNQQTAAYFGVQADTIADVLKELTKGGYLSVTLTQPASEKTRLLLREEVDELASWEEIGNTRRADLCRARIAELRMKIAFEDGEPVLFGLTDFADAFMKVLPWNTDHRKEFVITRTADNYVVNLSPVEDRKGE